MLLIHRHIGPQGVHIGPHQFFPQRSGIGGLGLPHEGSYVVIHGPPSATLEIDEPGFSVTDHHVPGVEVPVQERVGGFGEQIGLQAVEVLLQAELVKLRAHQL